MFLTVNMIYVWSVWLGLLSTFRCSYQ